MTHLSPLLTVDTWLAASDSGTTSDWKYEVLGVTYGVFLYLRCVYTVDTEASLGYKQPDVRCLDFFMGGLTTGLSAEILLNTC
ncbi:MAG: hypothetical protein ACK4SY_06500 [Pyrobaculum sp.]